MAKAWIAEHGLPGDGYSVVSPDVEGLEFWNVEGARSNVFVLGGRKRDIKASWVDVTAAEMRGFGATLSAAMKEE